MKYVIIPTGTNTAETRAVSPHSCSFFLFTTKRFLVLILVFPANSGTITFKHGNCSSAETKSIAERKKKLSLGKLQQRAPRKPCESIPPFLVETVKKYAAG